MKKLVRLAEQNGCVPKRNFGSERTIQVWYYPIFKSVKIYRDVILELFQVHKGDWNIIENGGNGWKALENDDSRSEIRPKQTRTSVFVTSFDWCVREMEFGLVNVSIDQYLSKLQSGVSWCLCKNLCLS